jgi:hypothetical protein
MYKMSETEADNVPRTPEDPSPDDVFDAMHPGEPYRVRDLVEQFDDVSRWTIQRRLDTLVDQDRIRKKKHAKNAVSYWKPGD